jgi:nitrite reductase/ring-hydroxylating ferredoxin subunit
MVRWGDRAILVVRRTEARYYAMQGTASSDGCFLRWEPDALQVISPCTHGVYDLQGHVIAGLTTKPLTRYAVFERDGVVYVTES